ncbi:hypothetical protein SAMN02982917_2116 [Azospirillum oryzae]|uniref:Class I SAM-dependent methyltransferase n=1 Tax=Azospirillum oryzae TaxID=286727 RepID=A0A1X7EYJ4_9PROT|nr:methyltransferase domain-containing protein [Azospirillum oryzae]SMF42343.1 hypothetical protein SAMN02982917_2116 [Azospirillum oryzae]
MDQADQLDLLRLREDPATYEQAILQLQEDAAQDSAARFILESCYLEADRAGAFARFRKSREMTAIRRLMSILNVDLTMGVVEVGGGPGFLAEALAKDGGLNVALLEPNGEMVTGTGHLRAHCPDTLTLWNDLSAWHADVARYGLLVTRNCIHHFPNISFVAATLRQKLIDGAIWFAVREWYADTSQELYQQLKTHPLSQRFGLYEWPFPARHYVEAIEIAGFELLAVVPAGYDGDCLCSYAEAPPDAETSARTQAFDALLGSCPQETVDRFWSAQGSRGKPTKWSPYLRPQVLVFRRRSI